MSRFRGSNPRLRGLGGRRRATALQVRRGLLDGGLPVPDGMDERYRASFKAMERMLLLLVEIGTPIVAAALRVGH